MYGCITDVPGIQVGHDTNMESGTGCTVVLCRDGAVGGVDVRGAAPGTRETDLLRPMGLVQRAHAILLSGGSAFGLDAATGVMSFLEDQGIGFPVGPAKVPIVPGAILFDLGLITHTVRPGPKEGYNAAMRAGCRVLQGSVGAGTGATVGKALGITRAVKGGIGTASIMLGSGLVVGAIVAVNAFGDVVDPDTGKVLAGPRRVDGRGFHSTLDLLIREDGPSPGSTLTNTTIGVIATNACLDKEQANRLAMQAHDGLALAVRPCHAMVDGDVFFALATGSSGEVVNMARLGAAVVTVVSRAIISAVETATGLGGVPAMHEVLNGSL